MARKISPIKAEYNRQRKRVNALLRSYRKKGLVVDFEIPAIPKKITQASVNRLAKITPKKVQQKTRGVDFETGEIISFTRAKANRRREVARVKSQNISINTRSNRLPELMNEPPRASDIIIDNFRINNSIWNEQAQEIINSWLDMMIDRYGKDAVADMLQKAEEQGMLPNNKIVYDAMLLRNGLAQMVSLMDIGQFSKEKLMDEIEYEESYEV